jgi:hypothetical protein
VNLVIRDSAVIGHALARLAQIYGNKYILRFLRRRGVGCWLKVASSCHAATHASVPNAETSDPKAAHLPLADRSNFPLDAQLSSLS